MNFFLLATLSTGIVVPIVACHRQELNAWDKLSKFIDEIDFTKKPFIGKNGKVILQKNATPEEKVTLVIKWIEQYIVLLGLETAPEGNRQGRKLLQQMTELYFR